MDFTEALKAAASATDALLDRLLPAEAAAAPRLAAAMRYAALGAGKRLRPFLVIESARLRGIADERAVRVGAALECVHCYSLVHDDLPAMDDDDVRRGKPSAHRAFDEATAILAGDALLTLAFGILADPATHADASIRCALIAMLAEAAGSEGMAGGQMLDLGAAANDTEAGVLRMQSLKTGALFRFACEAGAVLGGTDAQARAALRQYADSFGLAFQIADDLNDAEMSASEADKATLVSLLGANGARRRASRLIDQACAALAPYGPAADPLSALARHILAGRP